MEHLGCCCCLYPPLQELRLGAGVSHTRDAAGAVREHFPLPQAGLPLRGTSKMGALSVFNAFSWELGQWPPYVPYRKNIWNIT